MKPKTEADYCEFLKRVDRDIMSHRIIHKNQYTGWFEKGNLASEDVRHFAVQFSVFSQFFIVAQLKKVINAPTIEEMRASKEILLNELGVVFRRREEESNMSLKKRLRDKDNLGDPNLVNTEGTVDGGTFRFQAAHFEWLLGFIKPLGLAFKDIGKRKHGTLTTLHFTDSLEQIYGSADMSIAAGASFAIENWAAAGFWKELINGLKEFRERNKLDLPLAFFTWHDKVEDQHASHTQEELKHVFYYPDFNEDKFIEAGGQILDACAVFWDGLNEDRLKRKSHA